MRPPSDDHGRWFVMDERHGAAKTSLLLLVLLGALVCVDFLLVALHVAKPYFAALRPHHFSLEADQGIAEYFQYLKQAAIIVSLFLCWRWTRMPSFLVWTIFFAFMLYDDSQSVHERVGEWLAVAWALPALFGLRPQDLGEILFASFVALATLGALGATLAREHASAIVHSINVALLLVLLTVFGVAVDALHVVAYFAESRWSWMLAVIEDGGELLVMSAIAVYACGLAALETRLLSLPRPFPFGDVLYRYAFAARASRP